MMLEPTDQMTNGYTNQLSDKPIKLWGRGPFIRKRFLQLVPTTNGGVGTLKSNFPLFYLLRKPKLQDSLSDLQGINSLSSFAGTNGFPNFMTITDSDLIDDIADDQPPNQNSNSNSIVSQLNNAVQSLGLSNLPTNLADLQVDKNQQPVAPSISVSSPSSSGGGGGGNTQITRIPIGSAVFETFKPLEDYKKSLNPTGTFGHGFYGHHMHSHYPFHYPFHHHHITEHDHKDKKIKYIHVPIPYPVIHVKHIKHHDNHHKDHLSPWIWGLVAAALLPILLGLLLLPLGLLFAINLFTLLAVLGGGSTFIPINGTTGTITTGKRKRSVSSKLWDEKKLDETQTFVLDCFRRFYLSHTNTSVKHIQA